MSWTPRQWALSRLEGSPIGRGTEESTHETQFKRDAVEIVRSSDKDSAGGPGVGDLRLDVG